MEVNHEESGAPPSESSAPEGKNHEETTGDSANQVDLTEYILRKDAERWKTDLIQAKDKLKSVEAELDRERERQLKENEDWKTLYENERTRREELEGEYHGLTTGFEEREKLQAVEKAALQAGIRPEAVPRLEVFLADASGITTEKTTHGRVIVHGADHFVEELKKTDPYLFQGTKPPRINSGGGDGPRVADFSNVTAKDVIALERIAKRTNKIADWKRYEDARSAFKARK